MNLHEACKAIVEYPREHMDDHLALLVDDLARALAAGDMRYMAGELAAEAFASRNFDLVTLTVTNPVGARHRLVVDADQVNLLGDTILQALHKVYVQREAHLVDQERLVRDARDQDRRKRAGYSQQQAGSRP